MAARPAKAQKGKAEDLPLWQIGIFGVRLQNPSYPGSDSGQQHDFLLPVGTFRGKILRADENESPRARLFRTPMSDLDLSAAGYFSSKSEGTAREGMPDLDYVGELGPRYNQWLIRNEKVELRFAFPIRSVFASNLSRIQALGWSFTPTVYWDLKETGLKGVEFYQQFSLRFLDAGASGYFFNVDPQYSRPERKAYQSPGGYLGESYSARVLIRSGRAFSSFGAGVDTYQRSSFKDSPLLRAQTNWNGFFGIGYDMIDSEARAKE